MLRSSAYSSSLTRSAALAADLEADADALAPDLDAADEMLSALFEAALRTLDALAEAPAVARPSCCLNQLVAPAKPVVAWA